MNAVPSPRQRAAQESTTSPLILIVDDEHSIQESLSGVLEDEGLRAVVASSGEEALGVVGDVKPDLIFLDMWMPGLDGLNTLERLREIVPDVPVVMISGHATISSALDATKRGAFDFVEKPLDLGSILSVVKRGLSHRLNEEDTGDGVPSAADGQKFTQAVLTHPQAFSSVGSGGKLGQRTLRRSTVVYGQCLHSGQKSGLILEPLPKDSGIHFSHIGSAKTLPGSIDFVESTTLATSVSAPGVRAATIEHLMAALHCYRITNLLVKCNGEVPILDGSAKDFCSLIEDIGLEEQGGEWHEVTVPKPVILHPDRVTPTGELTGENMAIYPDSQLSVTYYLNYPAPVGEQSYTFHYEGSESFRQEIAPCRTFGFVKDIERLQRAGFAAGGRLNNFVLVGSDGIVNTDLRFPEELARHKILDILGDLYLLGRPLVGRVIARMTGHSDNVGLLKGIWRTIA